MKPPPKLPPALLICTPPNEKVPWFSRKKSRFSGKNRLNRVRLTCCSSASTCAKSVLIVRSATSPCVTAYFTSRPASASGWFERRGVDTLSVVTLEIAYGLKSIVSPARGASIPTSDAANCACWNPDCPRAGGTRVSVEISFFERFTRIALKPHTCAVPG
jgi:hypothetical protein